MATSMPWVKLYTDFVHDTKIGRLSRSQKLTFVQLIILAGECDQNGALIDGSEAMGKDDIARWLHEDARIISNDIDALAQVGIVKCEDGVFIVSNFEKRQGRPQSDKQEQWRERQARARTKSTIVTPTQNVTTSDPAEVSRVTHANVTPLDIDRDKDKDKKIEGKPPRTIPHNDAIRVYTSITGLIPNDDQKRAIAEAVTDVDLWDKSIRACRVAGAKGYKVDWLLEVYRRGGVVNEPKVSNIKGAPKESSWDIAMTKLMSEVEK